MMKSLLDNKKIFILYLMFLCSLSMFSTDIFLPAMPVIKQYFSIKEGQAQLIITVYFLGLGVSQLVSGGVSDRFGRRLTLLLALFSYILGSLGCALSDGILLLLISRFVQALGAGSIVVLWRAIVIDVFDIKKAGSVIATVAPAIIISPAVAPIMGGLLLKFFAWQSVFICLILMGCIAFVIAWYLLPETHQLNRKVAEKIPNYVGAYLTMFSSWEFIFYTCLVCFAYGGYFAYIAQSPFLFSKLQYNAMQTSLFYFPITIAFLIGSQLGKRLVRFYNNKFVIFIGVILFTAGASSIFIASQLRDTSAFSIVASFLFMVIGNGILLTVGISQVLTFFTKIAGTASGIVSFLQSMTAFLMTWLVATLNNNSHFANNSLSIPIGIAAISVLLSYCGIFFWNRQSHQYHLQLKEENKL